MSLRIRLARAGTKKRPVYRIVVADARAPRDGRFIERLGHYNPLLPRDHAERVVLEADKAKAWIAKGAKPTDRVLRFLDAAGIMTRPARNNPQKAQPGKKAVERAEARRQAEEDARTAAEQAAAEPAPAEPAPAEATAEEAPAEPPAEAPVAEEATAEDAASEVPAEEPTEEPAAEVSPEDAPVEEAAGEGEEAEKPAG